MGVWESHACNYTNRIWGLGWSPVPTDTNGQGATVEIFFAQLSAGDRSWQTQANCLGVDPDLFFPERGASTKEAKGVCRGCEVRLECLEYALQNGEKFGIWGGLSERERRRIRRQRALARRAAAARQATA